MLQQQDEIAQLLQSNPQLLTATGGMTGWSNPAPIALENQAARMLQQQLGHLSAARCSNSCWSRAAGRKKTRPGQDSAKDFMLMYVLNYLVLVLTCCR